MGSLEAALNSAFLLLSFVLQVNGVGREVVVQDGSSRGGRCVRVPGLDGLGSLQSVWLSGYGTQTK